MGHTKTGFERKAETGIRGQNKTDDNERRRHTNFQTIRATGNDTRHDAGIRNSSPIDAKIKGDRRIH